MKKTGTVEALNVSPKGFCEGFLLRTGKKVVQINLRDRESGSPDARVIPGAQVTVEVEEEEARGEPEHDVFRLIRLVSIDGHPARAGKHKKTHFIGSVKRLNYALHGEVNGGMLDTGDFLHLKPAGARAVKLAVGLKVEGSGATRPMAGGYSVIEAGEVNGIAIPRHGSKKKHAGR